MLKLINMEYNNKHTIGTRIFRVIKDYFTFPFFKRVYMDFAVNFGEQWHFLRILRVAIFDLV